MNPEEPSEQSESERNHAASTPLLPVSFCGTVGVDLVVLQELGQRRSLFTSPGKRLALSFLRAGRLCGGSGRFPSTLRRVMDLRGPGGMGKCTTRGNPGGPLPPFAAPLRLGGGPLRGDNGAPLSFCPHPFRTFTAGSNVAGSASEEPCWGFRAPHGRSKREGGRVNGGGLGTALFPFSRLFVRDRSRLPSSVLAGPVPARRRVVKFVAQERSGLEAVDAQSMFGRLRRRTERA